jgi:hypothetical protein
VLAGSQREGKEPQEHNGTVMHREIGHKGTKEHKTVGELTVDMLKRNES